MSETSRNNKRIAKNTLFLYFRMIFLMCISLYTSRVVLEALGVSDYGIYNVVGGFVAMFALISSSLTGACSRFLNYEMGRGAEGRLKLVFSTSLTVHIVLAIIIAITCETFGIWYVNNKMVIPEERLVAANWVFQISILNFCMNLITIPFNAAIIAHEKMSTFAYVSIYEGIARLLICFIVIYLPTDHLVTYAFLYMLVQISVMILYQIYCHKNFQECHFELVVDKPLVKQMFSYSGWHIIGNSASVLNRQGVDLVLNFFCGTVLNAAKGISNQVMNAVSSFANNFMLAMNPQITKSYANGDYEYMNSLVFRGSRFSFYLIFLLSFPIILNADFIIHLWLKSVPDYAVQLSQLALIVAMISSLSNPLVTAQNATGNVRNYQIVVGGIQLLNLPICYIVLKNGFSPVSIMVVAIFVELLSLAARLVMIPFYVEGFSSMSYIKEVLLNVVLVVLTSVIIPIFLYLYMDKGVLSFVVVTLSCLLFTLLSIIFVGCTKNERASILRQVHNVIVKIKH